MALANVAFMAAMNGLRVLIMDWDLEAPGLGYYFRGLMEPGQARALKSAPGILDLAWEWVSSIRDPSGGRDVSLNLESIQNGQAFSQFVRPVVDEDLLFDASLDILRAGGDFLRDGTSYEEALAEFSWPQFFKADGGGLLLSSLTSWARENYDLILVDSRTGLADVAGICTMQLPDTVALCFIYNRQNMEGVARVAGAIRAKRSEEVRLRAVPMRVASRDTSEEANARARARRELITVGGFSADAIDEDFRTLSIEASPNVPFYETLAPIVANDPLKDPLSQNYLALASSLLGRTLVMPSLSATTIERIRRRLQPKHATADYLLQLKSSVPERMFEEVSHLVESALDAQLEHDADLEDDYLIALVRAAFEISDEGDDHYATMATLNQALDLARSRASTHPSAWNPILTEALGRMLDYGPFLESDEELTLLDEIDVLLGQDRTIAGRLGRIRHRRRAARLHYSEDDFEAAFQSVAEIHQLIEDLQKADLAADQAAQLASAEADLHLVRGDIYKRQGNDARADQEFERGRSVISSEGEGRGEHQRFRFDFARRLALSPLVTADRKAEFALEAARNGTGQAMAHGVYPELAQAVLGRSGDASLTLQFAESIFRQERISSFSSFHGRHPRVASQFFDATAKLVNSIAALEASHGPAVLEDIGKTGLAICRTLLRRRATWPPRMAENSLLSSLASFLVALEEAKAEPSLLTEIRQYVVAFEQGWPARAASRRDRDSDPF